MIRKTMKTVLLLAAALSAGPALSFVTNTTDSVAKADAGCVEYTEYNLIFSNGGGALCLGNGTGCKICTKMK